MVNLDLDSWNTGAWKTDDKRIIWRLGLGSSKPMQVLPGMVSTTRIEAKPNERAKSFSKFTTCEPRTPVAGSIS